MWFTVVGPQVRAVRWNGWSATKSMVFIWISDDFSKSARAGLFEKLGCENRRCEYVFLTSDLGVLTKLVVV